MTEPVRPRPKRVLPLVSGVTFLGFVDTNLLIPVITLYAAGLGAGVGITGLIVGLYSLTNTIANILFGRLIDRVGYKAPLVASMFGDALSMFLYSLCRKPVHLALVRVLHGITGAATGPATMAVLANHSDEARQGRAMGFYGMAIGISTLVGFGLSGVLAARLGYMAVFYAGAGFLVVGGFLSLLLPPRTIRSQAVAGEAAVGGWQGVRVLLRRRVLVAGYAAIFAQYFTFGGVVTLLPLYVNTLGMEAFHVGMLLAIFAVMFVVMQLPVGVLSDRMGRLGLIGSGLGFGAVALVMIPNMPAFSWLVLAMVIYGAAYGAIFPSVSAIVSDQTAPDERGLAGGIFHALLTAGVAIGAPVIGGVAALVGVPLGLMLSAIIMVIAMLVVLAVARS